MTIYAYIRVSTNLQNCANQHHEIKEFANRKNFKVNQWIEEIISSRKKLKDRQLWQVLHNLKKGDTLIATEISRLGRNIMEVMGILQQCLEKGCEIFTLKEGFHLGTDIQSKVMAFAFSLASEIERELISQRTRECLKRLKDEGRHLGRPFGKGYKKLTKNHETVLNLLKLHTSKAEIARIMGCTWSTLYRYIQAKVPLTEINWHAKNYKGLN